MRNDDASRYCWGNGVEAQHTPSISVREHTFTTTDGVTPCDVVTFSADGPGSVSWTDGTGAVIASGHLTGFGAMIEGTCDGEAFTTDALEREECTDQMVPCGADLGAWTRP